MSKTVYEKSTQLLSEPFNLAFLTSSERGFANYVLHAIQIRQNSAVLREKIDVTTTQQGRILHAYVSGSDIVRLQCG
jgi:hypothetical protein